MKGSMFLSTFYIPLGDESEHPMDALHTRHALEREMKKAGLPVTGGGMGFGGMDITLEHDKSNEERVQLAAIKIIESHGFLWHLDMTEAEDEDYVYDDREDFHADLGTGPYDPD